MQSTQANVKQREMIDMKTSWHAFISGYICCRIYMITIEIHIDFLYLFFFFIHLSPPISSQLSRYLLLMSEWSHTDVREKAKIVYMQVKLRTRVYDLAEWQNNGPWHDHFFNRYWPKARCMSGRRKTFKSSQTIQIPFQEVHIFCSSWKD